MSQNTNVKVKEEKQQQILESFSSFWFEDNIIKTEIKEEDDKCYQENRVKSEFLDQDNVLKVVKIEKRNKSKPCTPSLCRASFDPFFENCETQFLNCVLTRGGQNQSDNVHVQQPSASSFEEVNWSIDDPSAPFKMRIARRKSNTSKSEAIYRHTF